MTKTHPLPRTPSAEPSRHTAAPLAVLPPVRPAWGPIDFEGDDTSLTQAHLALMK